MRIICPGWSPLFCFSLSFVGSYCCILNFLCNPVSLDYVGYQKPSSARDTLTLFILEGYRNSNQTLGLIGLNRLLAAQNDLLLDIIPISISTFDAFLASRLASRMQTIFFYLRSEELQRCGITTYRRHPQIRHASVGFMSYSWRGPKRVRLRIWSALPWFALPCWPLAFWVIGP